MDQAARWIDLKHLTVAEYPRLRSGHLKPRTWCPVRADGGTEVVLGSDLWVGDGLPQALRRRGDVNLEDLFHRALQSVLEVAQRLGPWLCVLAHPAVVDQPDRDRVQEVQLAATLPP